MNRVRNLVCALAGSIAIFNSPLVQAADELRTAIGGGAGAAAGAAVGQAVGGKTGAVLGAGVGGASGAVVGKNVGESSGSARRGDVYIGAAYGDPYYDQKKHKNKKKKNRCDEEHPGRGNAYGKYKDC